MQEIENTLHRTHLQEVGPILFRPKLVGVGRGKIDELCDLSKPIRESKEDKRSEMYGKIEER